MDGLFEEDFKFAVRVKILQRGGRIKGGRKEYLPYENERPGAWGSEFAYSRDNMFDSSRGCSSCFDHSDEVLILVAIATEDETDNRMPGEAAERSLEKFTNTDCYEKLKADSIDDYRKLYRTVALNLGGRDDLHSEDILARCNDENTVYPEMAQLLFNYARYFAICSGRPQPAGKMPTAPINLQGMWNEDLRPAWDCDYHLDLNVEQCYWSLDALGLGSLMEPFLDWVERMVPSGIQNAKDSFGCEGICFGGCCDYFEAGNSDNVGFLSNASFSAWLAQVLWQHWLYTDDTGYLKRIYRIMQGIAVFYDSWLEEKNGVLTMPFGTSPEMYIMRNGRQTFLASESSFDCELIHELFTNLVSAAERLNDTVNIYRYKSVLAKLPLPVIGDDGAIQEYLESFEIGCQEHRHRSHLVGLLPGERISYETCPEYAQAAYKALEKRHVNGYKGAASFSFPLDGQLAARLGKAEEAYQQLLLFVKRCLLPNLQNTAVDCDGTHGGLSWYIGMKVFTAEAQISMGAAILETVFQSRQGIMRFLPALPEPYSHGSIEHAPAQGGFSVSFAWEEHRVKRALVYSAFGGRCKFTLPDGAKTVRVLYKAVEVPISADGCFNSFNTGKANEYMIEFDYEDKI